MGMSKRLGTVLVLVAAMAVTACSNHPPAPREAQASVDEERYQIGPGDALEIVVWGNPEASREVVVPPDGYVSTPLVPGVLASGKTATELAADIEEAVSEYIKSPLVSVIVTSFVGPYERQVRVLGEAVRPSALQYRKGMTVLDVIIQVGGLTEFAAGNRAVIVRRDGAERREYSVRLDDLVRDGDLSANVGMLPGDILVIPESVL
ncbi:XrtA/PEP-CTERM system exopolysaccharide export protein [Arhodomonas sp. SL1]|uniref:XrtA/PEP-CTERM system exopolysaccharide export protein n=1 Tax=Arhodomonas sp. SL1 TaxID=3425691 RepID=UPI003F882FE6